jgi:hypothetical protein
VTKPSLDEVLRDAVTTAAGDGRGPTAVSLAQVHRTRVPVLGHAGFTGTELAVAPGRGISWALPTNRLHPTSTPSSRVQQGACPDAFHSDGSSS